MSGCHGKLLRVNLSDGKISEEAIPENCTKNIWVGPV
jgi:aldehyde:ferredoxin oxidoreductase